MTFLSTVRAAKEIGLSRRQFVRVAEDAEVTPITIKGSLFFLQEHIDKIRAFIEARKPKMGRPKGRASRNS